MKSALFTGKVQHRRFSPRPHRFEYSLYMLALCVDELPQVLTLSRLFGEQWFRPIRFVADDYIHNESGTLKQRIINKVQSLGGQWGDDASGQRVTMMVQCRCLGLYFSPINFYFCYDNMDKCRYMLAEVSNTPWNEKHYYLVDCFDPQDTAKAFHVSPFMNNNMDYRWRIQAPAKRVMVSIENHAYDLANIKRIFEATLSMQSSDITAQNLTKTWFRMPMVTLKIVLGIYYQAAKLFIKKIPFVGHSPDH
jgi:DUF1365 family protein